MSNKSMFIRMVIKSLNGKKANLAAGFLALFLASLLVAALFTVILDLPNSIGKELRNFGANFTLNSGKKPFNLEQLKQLQSEPFKEVVVAYVPFTYLKAKKGFKTYQLIGTDLMALKKLSPWIKFGSTALKANEALAGQDAASQLKLKKGDILSFTSYKSLAPRRLQKTGCLTCHKKFSAQDHRGQMSDPPKVSECLDCHDSHEKRKRYFYKLEIAGLVSSGGDEDNQLFTKSDTIFKTGISKGFKNVSLSVFTSKISEKGFAALIKKHFKGAELKSIKQISRAESKLLSKIRLLMMLLTAVVLVACGLSVTSTMSGIVMERRMEIGLMKAIGAAHGNIIILFMGELAFIAFLAGVLGYFAGLGLAWLLATIVFKAKVGLSLYIALISMFTALILVLIASIAPMRSALNIDPAQTLRGE